MQIATRLKSRLDFVRSTLTQVQETFEDDASDGFLALKEKVDSWAAKVAVIGQVKAGKSTFLNALMEQHDFLPSDINPWTSVVTNLRINLPNDPDTGVAFEFFSEEDWEAIIEGKSAIGDLSEELLPGFDADLLREQSKELREQAKARLGDHYHTMLGKSHEFNFSSPDLLKRYVCAASDSEQGLNQEALGRYASLTREANVYTRNAAYQVPTILTDTPGVNDPFLVRDEVTCRALDRSDMFIMVLSAHQPLTDIDLGLIRLLTQQNARDVLIFVNRLDELDQYDTRFETLLDDVAERLEDAIPGTDFTIVAGSGFMADATQTEGYEGQAIRDELDTPTLAAYLKAAYGHCPKDQNERLLLGSGLARMKEAISNMIDDGVAHRQVEQFLEDIRAHIEAMKFSMETTANSVNENISLLRKNNNESITLTVGDELVALKKAASDIDDMMQSGEDQLETTLQASRADLEVILNEKINAFLEDQEATIESSLMLEENQEVPSDSLTIYLGVLHREIEQAVSNHFETERVQVDQYLRSISDSACECVSLAFDEKFQDVSLDNLPFETFSTTLTMAKQSVEANLVGKRSMAFWKKKSIDLSKTVQLIKTLATAELTPAMDTIVEAYCDAHRARFSAGIERVSLAKNVAEQAFRDRGELMKQHFELIKKHGADQVGQSHAVNQLQDKVDKLKRSHSELSKIEESLFDQPKHEAA